MEKSVSNTSGLFSDFPPVSKTQWEELIRKQLKTQEYENILGWDTLEGVTAPPFRTREDLPELNHSSSSPLFYHAGWTTIEPLFDSEPDQANESARKAINSGAGGCLIRTRVLKGSKALGSELTGTYIRSQNDFNTLTEGFGNRKFNWIFDAGQLSPALLVMAQDSFLSPEHLSFIFDPYSYTAQHGRLPLPESGLRSLIRQLTDRSKSRILCADASVYHHAGASIVQELALALATFSEFLAAADSAQREKAADLCFARMAAGPLYFPEIAKFRAMRLLWKQLLEAYGIESDHPLFILSETGRLNKTITDPYNNILRSVTETMAAVTGGANAVSVQPCRAVFGQPDDFSKRIARNIQHILREEAHFDYVADPSSGSFYIETLTDAFGHNAWNLFRRIETEGGLLQALKNGSIQNKIRKTADVKKEAYETGKRVLTGTNTYPNPDESLPFPVLSSAATVALSGTGYPFEPKAGDELKALSAAFKNGALLGDVLGCLFEPQKVQHTPVEAYRAGRIFDDIRLRTKKEAQTGGATPVVQLVPVGDPKSRRTAASLARNVLGCAGFVIHDPSGYATIADAAADLEDSVADIYVLCESGTGVSEWIRPFCDAFAGRGVLLITGDPEERDAGIRGFIRKEMNLPEFLISLQQTLFENREEP